MSSCYFNTLVDTKFGFMSKSSCSENMAVIKALPKLFSFNFKLQNRHNYRFGISVVKGPVK